MTTAQRNETPQQQADRAARDEAEIKILARRYRAITRWFDAIEAWHQSWPKDENGHPDWDRQREATLPHPTDQKPAIRCPSKNSKWAAYGACRWLRESRGIEVDPQDIGSVREWRAVLVACGKNPLPLAKCNRRKED